jgi:hypothetical protein
MEDHKSPWESATYTGKVANKSVALRTVSTIYLSMCCQCHGPSRPRTNTANSVVQLETPFWLHKWSRVFGTLVALLTGNSVGTTTAVSRVNSFCWTRSSCDDSR